MLRKEEKEGGRFTLRSCHAFHAPRELPNIVFYVPKRFVARGGPGWGGRRLRTELFFAEAFMARGDPTLMLALEVGDTVPLTARGRASTTTTTKRTHTMKRGEVVWGGGGIHNDDDADDDAEAVCVIDALEMSASGRSARLELRLLFL
jgi:hypothetical protein